jgi:zinc finger CCCH domain-containing protein 13
MRLPPGQHQLQNALALNPMAGLGHPGNVDLRGPSHAQLLGMGGGIGGGPRGASGFGVQQAVSAQMQAPLPTARQQQHLPSHMVPHLLPPHLQQQAVPNSNNQPAHDLMALLMGGPNRE